MKTTALKFRRTPAQRALLAMLQQSGGAVELPYTPGRIATVRAAFERGLIASYEWCGPTITVTAGSSMDRLRAAVMLNVEEDAAYGNSCRIRFPYRWAAGSLAEEGKLVCVGRDDVSGDCRYELAIEESAT
jgi:hypothetical protein